MFENSYIVAFYGWTLANVILLGFAKDEEDDKFKPFDFKVWWKYNWDNVTITFIAIPAVVEWNPDWWAWIINDWWGKSWEYSRAALMGTVPFTQFLYFIIKKLKK